MGHLTLLIRYYYFFDLHLIAPEQFPQGHQAIYSLFLLAPGVYLTATNSVYKTHFH